MTSSRNAASRLLADYLAPQRGRIAALAGLMLVDLSLQLALPRVVQFFIDSALAGAALQTLTTVGVVYLAIAIAKNWTWVGWHYIAQNIGLIATNRIRADLTLHCLKLDMSFHNARTPGELIERIDGDVTHLTRFLSSFLVQMLINALLLAGTLAMLLAIDWRVGAPIAISVALAIFSARAITRRVEPLMARERQASAELYGFVEERLSGTEDIRANGGTAYVLRQHIEHSRKLFYAALKAALAGTLSWRTVKTAIDVGATSGLLIGALLHLDGVLSLGAVYLIFAYTDMLQGPVEEMLREFGDLQQASASIGRVQELFAIQPKITAPGTGALLPSGALAVGIDNVTFAYPGDDTVLHDVTLDLPAGATLGVLGRTGSGKTTLARLLLRLYDPSSGIVRIGGADARQISNDDLRARVAVVTQDVQIFSVSVRDNPSLFDAAISDGHILAALDAVGLSDWLNSLPRGLDSVLAAGGSGLSAGEAQLLAFARAFLRDPGLVILDEASSRLDPATERKLDQAVTRLLDGRTGIIIAHRLSTLQRVRQILILEDGRVRENGLREDLVRDPRSRFAQLLNTGIEQALA
jgi:ATP-binding cassette, subfamily B, bacterial